MARRAVAAFRVEDSLISRRSQVRAETSYPLVTRLLSATTSIYARSKSALEAVKELTQELEQ